MIRKFKIWFNTKILKKQVSGYRNKNGVVKITNIKYF